MFDQNQYMELILGGRLADAEIYKGKKTPNTMYKYMSMSSINDSSQLTDLDEKKLRGINSNTIWMHKYSELNDPFETKALYYEKSILEEKGWDIKFVEEVFDRVKGGTLITSFTTSSYNNMPMWAHYSNNHSGVCIEYEVMNSLWLYPVSYENNRVCINSIITNTINEIIKINKEGKSDKETESNIDRGIYIISIIGAMIKNKKWSYEEEWRLIAKADNPKSRSENISKFGLRVKAIHIGINCRDDIKNRLIHICKNINCELYEMILPEESRLYELDRVKINLD